MLPSKAAAVRKLLPPGIELTTLQVHPVTAELESYLKRYMPAHSTDLVGIASRWAEFQRIGQTMLVAAGLAPECLLVRDAAKPGWRRGLRSCCRRGLRRRHRPGDACWLSRHHLPSPRRTVDCRSPRPRRSGHGRDGRLAHFRFCPIRPTDPSRPCLTSLDMKDLAILLLAFAFVSSASGQALPDNPAPAPLRDAAWDRLQGLVNGQPIVVDNTNGPPVHCLFAGVTAGLPVLQPARESCRRGFSLRSRRRARCGSGSATRRRHIQASRPERNYHPAWISSMIAGGIIVGLVASKNTDAGTAAEDGIIGAGVVGLIGAPLAFLPHPQFMPSGPAYPQYGLGLRFRSPIRSRPHRSASFPRAPR